MSHICTTHKDVHTCLFIFIFGEHKYKIKQNLLQIFWQVTENNIPNLLLVNVCVSKKYNDVLPFNVHCII